MIVILIATLLSMATAKGLEHKSITLHIFGREYNVRTLIYFFPLWCVFVFSWNSTPDVTYPTGSYWTFFHNAVMGTTTLQQWIAFAKEPLSWGLMWFIAKEHLPYFIMLLIMRSIFFISFALYIDRFSKIKWLSILFFNLFGLPMMANGALRQAFSMTFLIIAYSIIYENKKKINAIFALLVGGLCHHSCWLMIPFFLVADFKLHPIMPPFLLIVAIAARPILSRAAEFILFFAEWSIDRILKKEIEFTYTYFLLCASVVLGLYFFYPQLRKIKGGIQSFNTIFYFSLVMLLLPQFMLYSYRTIQCFTPVFIIIIPNLIDSLRVRWNKALVLFVYMFVFGIYSTKTIYPSLGTVNGFNYQSAFFVENAFSLK